VTNNQAEYEALLAGLNLAYDMGAREVTCKSDSRMMVGQVNGEFEVKEPLLQRYYHAAKNSIARFSKAPLEHIPREDNKRADILSKLSVTKKKSHQRSVIQIWLRHPSVIEAEAECLAMEEAEAEADNWMTPVIQYLLDGTCKVDQEKAMKQQCARYTMQNFVWKSIVCRFGVPHTIITDNGRQFIDRGLQSFYDNLGIKSITTSVEHPQTNGQAEAANKFRLNELKKRLGKAKVRWTEELI